MKVEDLRIGMTVVILMSYPKDNPRESIPMQVTGILDDGTVYLDFEGNEGDVWEEDAKNLKEVKE